MSDAPVVIEKWQNLAATAPDGLSSVANFGSTTAAGATPLLVEGEYPVANGDVAAAKRELAGILHNGWLRPGGISPIAFTIDAVNTVEAAGLAAATVPMPIFNQWKLKSFFSFRRLSASDLEPFVNFLLKDAPAADPTMAIGALTILLMGGKSNRIHPNSAVIPARAGAVGWFHGGALWNEQSLEPQCLAYVDRMFSILKPILSSTAQYGAPDLQLGSQLASPPNCSYLRAYWSSGSLNFVPFLLGVKQRYDRHDVFRFAQSIPVRL